MSSNRPVVLAVGLVWFIGCAQPQRPDPVAPPTTKAREGAAKAAAGAKPAALTPAEPDAVSAACAPHDKKIAAAYAPYLDAFSNLGEALSPDGRRLLFRSNRGGGSYQLFVADARRPGTQPIAVAPAKDRVGPAKFAPDGRYILFTRDRDNDENWQIYRAKADGSEVVALTDAPDRFHSAPWTADGRTLYYLRGTHRSPDYELVAQSIEGGPARSILVRKGFHFISDIDRAGKHLLLSHLDSLSASQTLLVTLPGGEVRQLAPTKGAKAHAHSAVFARDGRSVYVVTDEGAERAVVRRLDLETGKVLASHASDQGEVAHLVADPTGRRLAALIDAGSHHAVQLLDARTLKPTRPVKLPLGGVTLGRFDAGGRRLVLTFTSPEAPTEVQALDARSGRLQPLRRDVRPGLDKLPRMRVAVERVDTFDELKVPVNVYLPRTVKPGQRLPVLVSVHGGPAGSSIVEWNPFASFFISRGFAVVEPNVRGSTGFGKSYEKADNGRKRMDAVKDLEAVNRWIRQQPWADAERLVVFGGSYGGYMTYMALGHQPKLWRAGIGLVGVVNLKTFLETTTGAIRVAFRDEFGRLDRDGAFLDSISPIRVVDRFKAPLFVYQGAKDPRVPRSEQDQLVRALRQRGATVEYMVAADEGHSLSHRHNKLQFIGRIHRFLDQQLGRPGLPEGC